MFIFCKLRPENIIHRKSFFLNHPTMKSRYLLILLLTTLYSAIASAQIQIGNDIDGESADDRSGHSVSMPDAHTVAIGAPRNDGNGYARGHVRIYTLNGTSWQQKGADIDGEAARDLSGVSVSMPDAHTVVIGAYENDGSGPNSGHVRIYSWNGSTWVQKGMDIDGEAAGDQSGYSVSMPDAQTVAIGAILNDGKGVSAGHVRIYTWNGTLWIQKGTDIDGEAARDLSGYSVSMPNANTVAIGAYENDGSGPNSGHVRIYAWNGTAWIQKGADIDGEALRDGSGWSVSMPNANTVAIGAPTNNGNGSGSGHVRVYSWNGSAWAQKGADINGEAAGDYSGSSVSMPDANTIAIGAPGRLNGPVTILGSVRIYAWNGTAWIQKGMEINGETAGDYSGWSISMPNANTLAIGAPWNDGNGSRAGHVRIFDLCDTVTTSTLSISTCDSLVSPSGQYIWTNSGTYSDTIPNSVGCDSLMTINLTILNSSSTSFSASACDAYSWLGNTLTSSGTYIDTLVNATGCDSIVTLNLTVVTIDTTVANTGSLLTAVGTASSYQWYDCNNQQIIPGANGASFTPTQTGHYAVILTENGCTDTSGCHLVVIVGTELPIEPLGIQVYPNPADDHITLELPNDRYSHRVDILNIDGKVLITKSFSKNGRQDLYWNVAPGVYLIRIVRSDGIIEQKRVVRQ
ncbi:MAG TPA: hypothetical protein DDX92_03895 [Flavobacteriales bacterium]|jgi:hypothetical protein|nr:hypothetical protein [Flavobacteriales bacterium]